MYIYPKESQKSSWNFNFIFRYARCNTSLLILLNPNRRKWKPPPQNFNNELPKDKITGWQESDPYKQFKVRGLWLKSNLTQRTFHSYSYFHFFHLSLIDHRATNMQYK